MRSIRLAYICTLFVIDLDDTLVSRTVIEQFINRKALFPDDIDSAVKFKPLSEDTKKLTDKMRMWGGGSKVIIVSNSSRTSVKDKLSATGIDEGWFDQIDCRDEGADGTQAGDKELRIKNYCQKIGFNPKQLVILDDEESHFEKLSSIATIMSIPKCITMIPLASVPHVHSVAAINQTYDTKGKPLSYYLKLMYREPVYQQQKQAYDAVKR